jgi:hypothetical protein
MTMKMCRTLYAVLCCAGFGDITIVTFMDYIVLFGHLWCDARGRRNVEPTLLRTMDRQHCKTSVALADG